MNNEDTIKRLEDALDKVQSIHTNHKLDSRNQSEAIEILEGLIKELKAS